MYYVHVLCYTNHTNYSDHPRHTCARSTIHIHAQKPSNVGFGSNGLVQLFDFGLARELDEGGITDPDQEYLMTGEAGSSRYMAPEVHLSKPYNLSCDVYSFSILLWQILSLEKPFRKMNYRTHTEKVVIKGRRPKIDSSWTLPIQELLKDGWNADLHKRPKMARILAVVESELSRSRSESGTQITNKGHSLHDRRLSLMPSVFSTYIHVHVRSGTTRSASPTLEHTRRKSRSNTM